jgi:hypothetical protein
MNTFCVLLLCCAAGTTQTDTIVVKADAKVVADANLTLAKAILDANAIAYKAVEARMGKQDKDRYAALGHIAELMYNSAITASRTAVQQADEGDSCRTLGDKACKAWDWWMAAMQHARAARCYADSEWSCRSSSSWASKSYHVSVEAGAILAKYQNQ